MKYEFWEGDHGTDMKLTPETPAEVAQLLRVTKNSKRVPIELTMWFENNNPHMNVWIGKIEKTKQSNTITNKNK